MHKRHLKKSVQIILLVIIIAIVFTTGCILTKKKQPTAARKPTVSTSPSPTPSENPIQSFSLFMEGDLLYQVSCVQDADNGDGTYDYAKQLDDVTSPAKNYDVSFYNQEVILGGDNLGFTPFPNFNAPQSLGDYMVSRGFNLVSKANNHALDKGPEGIDNSNAYWKTKKDVITSGTNSSQEERDAITVFTVNGIKVAFTAWTYGMNANVNPDNRPYLVNCYRGHEQEMLDDVTKAKQQADVVIVSMHWGDEYTSTPNEEQTDLAQQLSDAGADIIIGNHAHNIQPIQRINNHTMCFYALGNIISSQEVLPGTTLENINTGMAASLTVTKNEDGSITISEPKADLFYTWNENNYEHIHVTWYKDLTDEILPDHESYYQNYISSIVQSMDPDVTIGL